MTKLTPPLLALLLTLPLTQVGAGETAISAKPASARIALPIYTSVEQANAACDAALATADQGIARLAAEDEAASFLARWDALDRQMDDTVGPMAVHASMAVDKPLRDAAEACTLKFSELQNRLFQNGAIYQRLQAAATPSPQAAQVKKVLLEGFEDAGAALPETQRAEVKRLLDRIDALAQEFQRNVREDRSTIRLHRTELEGLPASYLDAHPADAEGMVTLTMKYPDYLPVMENALAADTRRRYYMAYQQIGGERNLAILQEVAGLRRDLAAIFGKSSYAHHALARRMAGTPENVTRFLDTVKAKLREVELRDLDVLRQAKAELLGRSRDEVKIERWDVSFYLERVRKQRYAIDQEGLRRYFPTEAAIAWLTDLAQAMYGVRFVPAPASEAVPVWHPDVRYFDILDAQGNYLAGAYFDLFPREGKYNHAAVWPVRGVAKLAGRTPISVLVANLNRQGLNHDELETLLHEFGHLLHGTLSQTHYNALAGTSVRRDFVEAPSQMFEEWARQAEPLALLHKRCATAAAGVARCPKVDKAMLARLNAARRFGAGIRYGGQHVLASFDMALAGPTPGDPLATFRALQAATPLGTVEGTKFPAQFGHIVGGYAAGYYGYMWSEVIALDMAGQWHGRWLDRKTSQRYRTQVLSVGGEVPAEQLVRNFLGREPSPEAFFAEISGRARR